MRQMQKKIRLLPPIPILVVLLAFVSRFVVACCIPLTGDELLTLQSAVFIQETYCWPVFRLGQDYMLAIDDLFANMLLLFTSNKLIVIRLFPCVISSVGIGLLWTLLKNHTDRNRAELALLPFIIPSSTLWMYSASAVGTYADCIFLIPIIIYCTVYIENGTISSRFVGAVILAIIGGVSLCVWRGLLFPLMLSLPFVLTNKQRRHARRIILDLLFNWPSCILVLLLVAATAGLSYRYLTRPATYSVQMSDLLLVGIALLCATSLTWYKKTLLMQLSRIALLPAGVVVGWLVIGKIVSVLFEFQKHNIYGSDTVLYHVGYSLRHFHEWWHATELFFSRVVPALWSGRIWLLEGGMVNTLNYTDTIVALVVGSLLFFSYIVMFSNLSPDYNKQVSNSPTNYIIIYSFIMMSLFLLPSHQNFGDYSYRYLVPFYPGILLLADNLVLLFRLAWLRAFFFTSLVLYNVIDLVLWVMQG